MAEKMRCYLCGNIGFDCDNGYYYCSMCNTQADDIAETAVEEDDYFGSNGRVLTQTKIRPQIKIEPETLLSQAYTQQSQFTGSLKFENESYEEPEPPTLMDFGGTNDTKIDSALYAAEIRMRYVQGIQLMIQFQCETLVEKFGVSPVICGLVGVIWLRFVTVTRVFEDNWMDETIALSESQSTKTPSTKEYSKDLQTYLSFCKDLIFAGQTPILENMEEEKIIEQLWTFYENQEVSKVQVGCTRWLRERESKAEGCVLGHSMNDDTKPEDNGSPSHQEEPALRPTICDSVGNSKDRALRKMKLNMEENGFLYIPPRVDLKRFDYLHYVRKNNEGSRVYVAHADYYILLRACALVAQVDVQYMHAAVLRVEKRLAWIENRIDQSLDWRVQNRCLESKT